jgi:hypothetical protein
MPEHLSDSLSPRSGERARMRGRPTLSRGRAPHPPRFARRPLPAARGAANLPGVCKSSILPSIQTVWCSNSRHFHDRPCHCLTTS